MNKQVSLICRVAPIIFFIIFCFTTPYTLSYAQNGSDLSSLSKWVNKDPFVKFNGKMLFDTKEFQTAFKKTVGNKIYKIFMDYYKESKYFGSIGDNREVDGVLTVNIQELAYPFNTAIFINTKEGNIDVCWRDGNDGNYRSDIILHNGKIIKNVKPECDDMSYNQFLRASTQNTNKQTANGNGPIPNSNSKQKGSSDTIAGSWAGELQMSNEEGAVINTKYLIEIEEIINKPGSYIFEENLEKKASKATVIFRCTGTNFYRAILTGYVVFDQDNIKLVANNTSNPSCVKLGANTFKFNNGTLSNNNMDGTNKLVVLHRSSQQNN